MSVKHEFPLFYRYVLQGKAGHLTEIPLMTF